MKSVIGYFWLVILGGILLVVETNGEDMDDAASYSRWMVHHQVKGVIASFNYANKYFPFATVEDFCDDGAGKGVPHFLFPDVSSTANNLEINPNGTIAISVANCSTQNYDSMPFDQMACYRVILMGNFSMVNISVLKNTTDPNLKAYYGCHPASRDWVQGQSAHTFYFWTMTIQDIFYIGGYGDLHYIGPIDLETYFSAKPKPPPMYATDEFSKDY